MQKFEIFSDGGSRGNPGPAGVGIVIKQIGENTSEQVEPIEISEYIGEATNNQAEYTAVVYAFEWIKKNTKDDVEIQFFLDSQLVVEQLNGNYKMKNEGLKPLFWQIREMILDLGGKVSFKHIPREQNKEADALVNKALDMKLNGAK